jgi:hypothetical protein
MFRLEDMCYLYHTRTCDVTPAVASLPSTSSHILPQGQRSDACTPHVGSPVDACPRKQAGLAAEAACAAGGVSCSGVNFVCRGTCVAVQDRMLCFTHLAESRYRCSL